MARRGEGITRGEIDQTIEGHKEAMGEKESLLEDDTSDVETIRKTMESLSFEGAQEDNEAVRGAIEDAEDVTTEKFERDDEELEGVQSEANEFAEEMERRKESGEADLGRISDASAELKTQESTNEFGKVKAATMEGIERLAESERRALEGIEKSDAVQEGFRSTVGKGRERR